jgi:muramoyltetrapeptide carboxypeptidase LdcA involved in peptidoglycan recycling
MEARETYREQQRSTVRDIVHMYNPDAAIVSGLDFGHTSPTAPVQDLSVGVGRWLTRPRYG